MGKRNQSPSRLEAAQVIIQFGWGWVSIASFSCLCDDAFRLLGGSKFDDVGDEEMAWNEEVEDGSKDNVLAAVVVTSDADENTILYV